MIWIILSIIFSVLCGVYMAFYLKRQKEQYDKNIVNILKNITNKKDI